jgi:hypothetical protein
MLKLSMSSITLTVTLFVISGQLAQAAPKALIYKGPGACEDGCADAFVSIARDAGFDPVFVGPEVPKAGLFTDAAVWIQPGGYAGVAMQNMSQELKSQIREFVKNGGGYVGYCAGAFTATSRVGTTRISGLGIFPGGTKLYGKGIDMKTVTWNGSKRQIYWEGGPYLRNLPNSVEVIAHYSNGAVATARTEYGKGRVFVTGLHPEAPDWWVSSEEMEDIDGVDHDLVVEMLHWASRK